MGRVSFRHKKKVKPIEKETPKPVAKKTPTRRSRGGRKTNAKQD